MNTSSACSLGLSATSQQYFSRRTNQPPATSRNQPAVLFSQNKPAPAISHQPTEQAPCCGRCLRFWHWHLSFSVFTIFLFTNATELPPFFFLKKRKAVPIYYSLKN
jgi:hypothetical protein